MVSTSQIGIKTARRAIHGTISSDSDSALSYHLDGQTVASTIRRTGDRPDELLSWMSLLRVATLWEAALIVVLFLLIGGLVGVRLAETLSERDVELASHLSVSADAAESAVADETLTDSTAADSSPTESRSYDQYFSPDTPSELLSDEGMVVRLLVANDGRIRQHQIADKTGWSKSKVSRICSQMHDDGMIEKTSAGRENVIILSEQPQTQSDDVENPVP
ncbi:helix-turn-helix transcriptional regulator [Natronorubrum aibiense]|uniref:MarR family transcriptional regulator n=1 Tax=Natronorubrum aibiense TaxID=348826 RepID=A0A5P9P4P4_9EURY|nr:MarR family transcriptional regulator [Natronorubrum aibiense]QFU83046.1 MarR family transcriptional regulator [Natronorubrum aibiense]